MDANTYNATIKLFGSEWQPEFESPEKLTRHWGRNWGCDNDVGQLRAVLVHRPGHEFDIIDPSKRIKEIGSYGDPKTGWYWQSKRIPPLAELQAQHDALVAALKEEGAEVIYLEGVEGGRFKSIYTRDSSLAVKGGAIVCRMAPRMRHGEELPVTRTLAKLGMPILRTLHGTAMMEGGTFAWLNATNAVIGRSIRANDDGIQQIAEVLKWQGVTLHVVDLCGYDIHIDGSLCMIDVNLALVNPFGLAFTFLETLKELGIRTIEIGSEDDGWIINCLAVRPGRVLMPDGLSDGTRKRLEKAGVEIVPLPYASVQLNGGGIHCSTCPLIRDPV